LQVDVVSNAHQQKTGSDDIYFAANELRSIHLISSRVLNLIRVLVLDVTCRCSCSTNLQGRRPTHEFSTGGVY